MGGGIHADALGAGLKIAEQGIKGYKDVHAEVLGLTGC
jgi:hypothetical protein